MNTKISPNEWQTLSAYIDGQLNARERRQLEARLQSRPELQEGLEDLRRTRALLRVLPKRRAVRNFTLTPAMVPQKTRSPFPVLRLASALASFLLVMAFLSDLAFSTSIPNLMKSSQPESPQAAAMDSLEMESAPASPEDTNGEPAAGQAASPTEELFAFSAKGPFLNEAGTPLPADGMGGSGGGTDDEPSAEIPAESPPVTPGPTPDATQQAIIAATLAPPGKGGGDSGAEATPPAIMALPAETIAAQQAEEQNDSALRSVAPPSPENEAGEPETGTQMTAPDQDAERDQLPANTFDPRSLLRPAEFVLAGIAIVTGLLAWYFRGKSTS